MWAQRTTPNNTPKFFLRPILEKKNIVAEELYYQIASTRFGTAIVVTNEEGVCYLAFIDNVSDELKKINKLFSRAVIIDKKTRIQEEVLEFISGKPLSMDINLLVRGTEFQIKVWNQLLDIPLGKTKTYGELAHMLNLPGGARAVGAAVGDNTMAYLIPCHRVVHTDGKTGKYRWGKDLKIKLLIDEGSLKTENTLF